MHIRTSPPLPIKKSGKSGILFGSNDQYVNWPVEKTEKLFFITEESYKKVCLPLDTMRRGDPRKMYFELSSPHQKLICEIFRFWI